MKEGSFTKPFCLLLQRIPIACKSSLVYFFLFLPCFIFFLSALIIFLIVDPDLSLPLYTWEKSHIILTLMPHILLLLPVCTPSASCSQNFYVQYKSCVILMQFYILPVLHYLLNTFRLLIFAQ